MTDMGKCGKCASEISVEADRCPECGYEPSDSGIISSILFFAAFLVFGFSAFMILITPILLFEGLEFSSGMFSIVFFGFFASVTGIYMYRKYKESQLTPVNDKVSFSIGALSS